MRLYLLRHAEAENTAPDETRELTAKGEKTLRKLCQTLKPEEFDGVRKLCHSPLTRAVQTARLFKDFLKLSQPLQERAGLRPEDNPFVWLRELAEDEDDLMFIGHNPHLSILADALMLQSREGGLITFRKAGLLCLRRLCPPSRALPYGEWTLEWFIVPRVL
ncbi:phosphohistidine phosphatase SixA [Ruficoccus amylovorans]|uniref:Phosphohistidine phosphatase SixA n=1 Tax=Ruficoccus amylovorans TaxID=1804625 RepID=A0A842HCT6_9BACT|nr:phosphohistidine phosphatase SixA [Ruficoccus amylovorans]MBC2594283.1 phosphohistidine phosphatase SixA [Ruficoccus amylovorans]